jgi:Flp pilus assembly protein TadG
MLTSRSSSNRQARQRRGAVAVLVALCIPILLILTAFCVNVTYMQMVREQLRVVCDASAKAALVNYGTNSSQSTAIAFAQTVANQNLVGGTTLSLSSSNVTFGNATQGGSGVYAFTAGGTPVNAVQVIGTVTPSIFMKTFLTTQSFTTSQTSVATRVCYDICLALDRSASMAFDLSSSEFSYPSDVSSGATQLQCYFTPPSMTGSRWYELTLAVQQFISTLQSRSLNVDLALVTYAENYTFGTYSATEATLDQTLTSNYTLITNAMNAYSANPLLGDTNMSAGMALAQGELTSTRARPTANRVMILLTDGVPTSGNTNISSLTGSYCSGSDIMTYVITFGAEASSGANETAMQAAATAGNGQFYAAPTSAALSAAFVDIADSLPAVLIK